MLLWPVKNEVKICERNSFADTEVKGEGEGEGTPGAGAEISL